MFSKDRFIEECIASAAEGQVALRELVTEAVADRAGVLSELGEPQHAGITPLYRSPQLTILNFVWAPSMILMPHNHQMWAVIGIYTGREDNVFWRRTESSIEAAGARSLGPGEVATLGPDIIHSVINPIGKMTCALHVYGGDFFQPPRPRSEWEHETLTERPWDLEGIKRIFRMSEERFNAVKA